MRMKKILIVSFSDLKRDPRVNRQIRFLKGKYQVSTVGLKSAEIEGVEFHPVALHPASLSFRVKWGLASKLRRYETAYWYQHRVGDLLKALPPKGHDLIIANDIDALPFVTRIAQNTKILLDAHEYTPRENDENFVWRFFIQGYKEYLCKKYIKCCHGMITVSEGIAEEYYEYCGIRPTVVVNASDHIDMSPSPVNTERIELISHGHAAPSRQIERMIEMMSYLDEKRFVLTLMLLPTYPRYLKKIKGFARHMKNIHFIDPVPMDQIIPATNRYDIGIFLLEPSNLNYRYVLPNKFFEFVQARLVVAIGPSPEMAKIVHKYDCGVVAEDFSPEGMARALSSLSREQIEYYKRRSDEASRELSSASAMQKLDQVISEMIGP